MGIYDRDYYQSERPAGIQLGDQWSMVAKLIAINVAVFVVDIFMNQRLMSMLAASPRSLTEPWLIWQLVTYGFAHDPNHVSHIFWNMFALFVFGRDVESVYGAKELVRIYLVTVVLGALFWTVRGVLTVPEQVWDSYRLLGASGAVTAITLLFCIHFPKRTLLLMFVLPVPAWSVGLLIIAVNLFGWVNPGQENIAFDVHLVGAAFAIAYYKFGWNLGRLTPGLPRSPRFFKPKPRLKIHHPNIEDPYRNLDAEADSLLAKVKREGVESLSEPERRLLEDYSRRMRQKYR